MRKTVLLCALTLVVGFTLGIVCSFSFTFFRQPLTNSVAAAPTSTPIPVSNLQTASLSAVDALDETDNTLLLQRAGAVLKALRASDYAALSLLVHPERGISFTPYSTVAPEIDLTLQRKDIAGLEENSRRYIWGTTEGKGDPIEMTMTDYFSRYVYNADYAHAPTIGVDTVVETGNAQENVADAFPQGRFVEYHFPGLEPKYEGFDWCSLKLVFEVHQNNWMLVGLIHSEWTP